MSRGEWFDEATESVLEQTDRLSAARGPLELEQATAELTGAALYEAIQDELTGRDFDDWLIDLITAAAAKADGDEGALRLLYGLAAIAPVKLAAEATRRISQAAAGGPAWLRLVPTIEAGGDVWRMQDVYRSRIALIADFRYPFGAHPSVFLFDIDAGGEIQFVEPGVYDDLAHAAEAWRASVGETAPDSPPVLVESPDDLLPLIWVHTGDMGAFGDETRAQTDNWFRAARRIQEVFTARDERGLPEPPDVRFFHDDGSEALAKAFTEWYGQRHGTEPDQQAVAAIASDWMRGTLPDVVHSVSPSRLAWHRPDDPAAKALFPEWARWHGEQARLPRHLIDQAVAEAAF